MKNICDQIYFKFYKRRIGLGDEVWNKYIKTGKVKGASVEGNFLLNFSREDMDVYLIEQVINILKNTE